MAVLKLQALVDDQLEHLIEIEYPNKEQAIQVAKCIWSALRNSLRDVLDQDQ